MHRSIVAWSAAALLAFGIGTAVAQPPPPPPNPYGPIPPPRAEVVPPPRTGYYWEPGHWHWNGVQYVWFRGRYVVRGPNYAHYAPGHWVWRPAMGRWVWIGGHWE